LTITNRSDEEIGCVGVLVPSHYDVDSAAVASVSNGGSWSTSVGGSSFHWVLASAGNNGSSRLDDGETLVLRITVTGTVSGRQDWVVATFGKKDCDDEINSAKSVQMTVSGSAPKPTPKPKPKATPKPTPAPTAAPRSTPSPKPAPTKAPKKVVPPSRAPTSAPVAVGGGTERPGSSGGGSGPVPRGYYSIPLDDNPELTGFELEVLAALGVFAWVVPGAILTVPSLLLIVIIGAQMLGGVAWLPVARRKFRGTGVQRVRHARPG
jgi:hypothetical protein